ncbi:MAG: phosphoenolpyruvate--protein phosphotransferase [Rhodovibrionaceae bacterium]|nr:phosphoenolpyruvate--protein phosphotransferase [Rhodovibrionaceae bacterium]
MAQAAGWGGPRRLLRLLRDLMKGGGSAQSRLDRIVELVAQDLVAEVCSIYVLRAGEVLELFATKGLKPEAVHRTRLRVGEGLVGVIALRARPLALSDAQSHPSFAYRPETGEEIYHSLLGVPILRGGRVQGVLVVQNATQRTYTDEEVEALETVAMVLAELVAGGELVTAAESRHASGTSLLPARFSGVVLNAGLAMGQAVAHQRGIVVQQIVAEDPAVELERLAEASAQMRSAIDDLLDNPALGRDGEHQEVLETYRMFARDRGWLERIREAVRTGLTAEAAVMRVQTDTRARMGQVKDPYIRERLSDLEDLTNRLLQHLTGAQGPPDEGELPDNMVLIARTLGPAELLEYDRTRLRAVVMQEGSPTAHVAIVARALNIPMIGRCREVLSEAHEGDPVIVDGDTGQVLLRPRESVRHTFAESMALRARRMQTFAKTRDLPSVTRDGVEIRLQMNAGLLIDLPQMQATGADGIGLYRTEVPFMVRNSFPGVKDQMEVYARVLKQADGRSVVFRTLDIGGDKALPYWSGANDENPALGWRAIRIGLDRPAILRQQLRAFIMAAEGRELSVMFPMISTVAEFESARRLLHRELERAARQGAATPETVRIGVMLEVPALAWQLDALMARADFVSVGSNDLFQFLFASDRGNPRLSRRYDPLCPAMLKFMRELAHKSAEAGVPLSVCGEMAGHPLEAMALIGCGLRTLSMVPGSIAPVKTMLRSADLEQLSRFVRHLSDAADHSVRERLRAYALDRGIAI